MPQNETKQTGVLIIGAGPTGLSLACDLARRNTPFIIVDQRAERSTHTKAIVVHARTLEHMEALGALPGFEKSGNPVAQFEVHSEGKQLLRMPVVGTDSPFQYMINIPQGETERILEERLNALGHTVLRNSTCTHFSQNGGSVTAHISTPGEKEYTLTCQYLVGCDGAHSCVRRTLDLPFAGKHYDETFILADAHINGPFEEDTSYLFFHHLGFIALFAMKGPHWRIIASSPEEAEPSIDLIERMLKERQVPTCTITDATWLSKFKIHHRIVPEYQVGRVFLAGDAAHIHSPAAGQGMNTGIQDALNLSWKLDLVLKNRAKPDLLKTYNTEREPIGHDVVGMTDHLTKMALLQNKIGIGLRNRILPILANFEPFREKVVNKIEELRISYASSPIVSQFFGYGIPSNQGSAFMKAPISGQRAPDGIITDALDGAPKRLFELYNEAPNHTLLVFTSSLEEKGPLTELQYIIDHCNIHYASIITPIIISGRSLPETLAGIDARAFLDPRQSIHEQYGTQKATSIYLIRPDGYIGYRAMPPLLNDLRDYLKRVFL